MSRRSPLLPSALPKDPPTDSTTTTIRPTPSPSTPLPDPSIVPRDQVPSHHQPFSPFFTIIASSTPPTTAHPTVHYIFSDDDKDADPITAAALRIHDSLSSTTLLGPSTSIFPSPSSAPAFASASPSNHPATIGTKGAVSAPAGAVIEERYVLVTLTGDGRGVTASHSMTGSWAVRAASVTTAPTLEGGAGGGGDGAGGADWERDGEREDLMLRIEGSEVPQWESGGVEGMGLEALCESFRRRMGELKALVEGEVGADVR